MPKITRANQKIFASLGTDKIGKFGSLAEGTPEVVGADPVAIQALGRFDGGWASAILGGNSPAIEDMNALFYLAFRQIAYILQQGVAEWNAQTSYYIGSMVNSNGALYKSLTDDNLNNPVTDATKWREIDTDFLKLIDSVAPSTPSAGRSLLYSGQDQMLTILRNNRSNIVARQEDLTALNVVQAVTWSTQGTTLGARSWGAVAFGFNSSMVTTYVATSIDGGAAAGAIYTSTDGGNTWVSRTPPVTASWRKAVGWINNALTSPLFIAAGLDVTTSRIITSPDGITWTSRTVPGSVTNRNPTAIARCGDFGSNFYLIAFQDKLVRSANDGVTWTDVSIAGLSNISGIVAVSPTLFYLIGYTSTPAPATKIYSSTDGIIWTEVPNNLPVNANGLAVGFNGVFVSSDPSLNKSYYSNNAQDWFESANGTEGQIIATTTAFLCQRSGEFTASVDGHYWVKIPGGVGVGNSSALTYDPLNYKVLGVSLNASDAKRSFVSLRV